MTQQFPRCCFKPRPSVRYIGRARQQTRAVLVLKKGAQSIKKKLIKTHLAHSFIAISDNSLLPPFAQIIKLRGELVQPQAYQIAIEP